MTIEEAVDEVIYRNYRHKRDHSPSITPERWRAVYGEKVTVLEARYLTEKSSDVKLRSLAKRILN